MEPIQSKIWLRSDKTILGNHQPTYLSQYSNINELLSNGRRNILVVAAHQDDEIIGMGGTIALYSSGIDYAKDWQSQKLADKSMRAFLNGGLGTYSEKTVSDLMQRLEESGRKLILPPNNPSNVIVVYVTNGAKTEQTVKNDLLHAHPEKTLEEILDRQETSNLQQITERLNQARYPETLAALRYVGATTAIFLEYQSSQIGHDSYKPAKDLAEVIRMFKPESIFTLSPFEFSHNSHILVSDLTVNAVRLVQDSDYNPSLKGYPVWDPDKLLHIEIVDISEVLKLKLDAIHLHSSFGSQGEYGRRYEDTGCLNQLHAVSLTAYDYFNASMQRQPRLPANIMAVEIFTDMNPLLKDDNNMTLKGFVEEHFQERLRKYPIN